MRTIFQSALLGALVAILVLPTAAAVELRGGQNVSIAAAEVIEDDLYVTGDSVVIDGVVHGDIVAVGRHVVLNGAALGDFIAAGQAVVVNGQVADDVRIAGFGLRLGDSAAIGDDVIAGGFSLEASRESLVAGSVLFSGFQALLAGEIRERVLGQMAALRIEGMVFGGGEVAIEAGQSTPPFMQLIPSPVIIPTVPAGLTLGPLARISEEFIFTSSADAVVDPGGEARLTHVAVPREVASKETFAEHAADSVWRFVSVLVVGLVSLLVVPGWLRRRADYLGGRPLASAGWGIAAILGWPIAFLVLTVLALLALILLSYLRLPVLTFSVVALALLLVGFSVVFLAVASLLLGPAAVCLWLGRLLLRSPLVNPYLALGLGWVLTALLFIVPVIGGLAKLLALIVGLGAVAAWALPRTAGRSAANS